MRRGRLNAEAPLGQLGETHSVGQRMCSNNNFLSGIFTRWHKQLHNLLWPVSISLFSLAKGPESHTGSRIALNLSRPLISAWTLMMTKICESDIFSGVMSVHDIYNLV